MRVMKMKAMVAALTATLAGVCAAAADGSSEAKAVSLTAKTEVQTRDFTLLQPQGTNFVFFFKMKLTKKKAYTIWLSNRKSPVPGETPKIAIAETYPESSFVADFSKNPPSADFESVTAGEYVGWVMTGRNWEKENDKWDDPTGDDITFKVPSTWTYYIVVRGALGESATLNYCLGNKLPSGIYQNPLVLNPTTELDGQRETGLEFYTQNYFLQTDFEMGRRYYLATEGGVEGNAFAFDGLPAGQTRAYPDWETDGYNDSRIFIPDASRTSIFSIFTDKTEDFGLATVRYRVDPSRTIAQHDFTPLAAGVATPFTPGHLNAWDSGAYDAIIDEALFKFTAAKNQRYIIQATWDDSNCATGMLMRVYDAKGNVLAQNRGDGSGLNARCAIDAQKAKADFYVGVCEDLGERDDFDEPKYWPAQITVTPVADVTSDPVTVHPVAVLSATAPLEADPEGEDIGGLSSNCWYRIIRVNARAGVTYDLFPTSETTAEAFSLTAELFTGSGKKEKSLGKFDFTPGSGDVSFTAETTEPHYVRIFVKDGLGLDHPTVTVHSVGYSANPPVGSLRVAPLGAPTATWKLTTKGEKQSYNVDDSILLPVDKNANTATYTIQYGSVKGYNAPAARTVTVIGGEEVVVDDGRYTDTYDPKDDYTSGTSNKVKYAATGWTLKTSETIQRRTLWENDEADNFTFTTKDGYYLDFYFTESSCDAVFTIFDAQGGVVRDEFGGAVENKEEIRRLALRAGKYVLRVTHGTPEKLGGSYALAGLYANVGAIKFAKAAVSVKDTATTLTLNVNRTAKTGSVRVRYETMDGTATAGGQFYAASGFLEWDPNDSKAKTVTIRMIPKLGAWYDGGDKTFFVRLTDAHEEGDYTAQITLDTCTVTVKESSKATVTQESVYLKKAAKTATVKKTEDVPLETGTFVGYLREQNNALTNGLPEFASVTLTSAAATTKKPAALTAKVVLGGKTYTFKSSDGWDDVKEVDGVTNCIKTLSLVQKINKIPYTNECTVVMPTAETTSNAWMKAIGSVKLRMNVPDANGKGAQTGLMYEGGLIRKNEKVQGYLDEVVKFAGYYTVALAAKDTKATDRGEPDAGTPEGNGYVTMTVSNKGVVKLAGLLPDGTKITSSTTAALVPDETSPLGYALYVPVYQAKSPYVLAGELWIEAVSTDPALRPDGLAYDLVVSKSFVSFLVWNNDNAKLTYDGRQGWRKTLEPVGGWYDTVFNLQSYYRDAAYVVETAGEFPKEALASGYRYVETANACPSNTPALLAGDAFSLAKKAMVKSGKLYDLEASVNPCNVQVKLARATGVVTGSFSLWSETDDAKKQKEITGFKHYGIILLQRDPDAVTLAPDVFSAGHALKSLKVSELNAKGKPVSRSWKFSVPFNLNENVVNE